AITLDDTRRLSAHRSQTSGRSQTQDRPEPPAAPGPGPDRAAPATLPAGAHPPRALPPMEKFVIEGGVPLSGTVVPAGNKNGALPILAACLLTTTRGSCPTCRRSATLRRWRTFWTAPAPGVRGAVPVDWRSTGPTSTAWGS